MEIETMTALKVNFETLARIFLNIQGILKLNHKLIKIH